MSDDQKPPRSQGTVFRPSPLQALQGGSQPQRPAPMFSPPGITTPDPGEDDVPAPAAPARIRNQLMADAGPFLSLIARVRLGEGIDNIDELHDRALRRLRAFAASLDRRGADGNVARNAAYALAATMDDVVQNMPGRAGADWARRSMVVMTFGEALGGDRFWELLEDMLRRPADNTELIELFHACIAAGFEGRYRVASDGARKRTDAMTAAYAALPHARVAAPDLSPSWRGVAAPMRKFGYWPIILGALAGAALLCFLIWLPLRLMLGEASQPARTAIAGIIPDEKVSIAGEAPVVAEPSTRLDELTKLLGPQIQQKQIVLENKGDGIHIRILSPNMFRSGSTDIEASHLPIFTSIAAALDGLNPPAGSVRIDGHTDSDPPRSLEYDNKQLSQARAKAAQDVLAGLLKSGKDKLTPVGKGDSFPVRSKQFKEENRRIEVVVPGSG